VGGGQAFAVPSEADIDALDPDNNDRSVKLSIPMSSVYPAADYTMYYKPQTKNFIGLTIGKTGPQGTDGTDAGVSVKTTSFMLDKFYQVVSVNPVANSEIFAFDDDPVILVDNADKTAKVVSSAGLYKKLKDSNFKFTVNYIDGNSVLSDKPKTITIDELSGNYQYALDIFANVDGVGEGVAEDGFTIEELFDSDDGLQPRTGGGFDPYLAITEADDGTTSWGFILNYVPNALRLNDDTNDYDPFAPSAWLSQVPVRIPLYVLGETLTVTKKNPSDPSNVLVEKTGGTTGALTITDADVKTQLVNGINLLWKLSVEYLNGNTPKTREDLKFTVAGFQATGTTNIVITPDEYTGSVAYDVPLVYRYRELESDDESSVLVNVKATP